MSAKIVEKLSQNPFLHNSKRNTGKKLSKSSFSELFKLIKDMQRPEECLSKKNGWISGVKALLHFSLIYFHVLNPSSTVAWQKLPKIVLKHQQSHSHWRGLNRVKAPSKSYSWRIVIIWLPGSSLEDPSHKDVFVWPDQNWPRMSSFFLGDIGPK